VVIIASIAVWKREGFAEKRAGFLHLAAYCKGRRPIRRNKLGLARDPDIAPFATPELQSH